MPPLSKPSLAAWGLFFRSYIHLFLNFLPFYFLFCFVFCALCWIITYYLPPRRWG